MTEIPVVDRSSPLPLWAQVRDDLRLRLAYGDLDADFPTEAELIRHYGVSRHTVREALAHLEADGLVVRERGRGTVPARLEIEQPLHTFYSLARSVRSRGLEDRSEVLALEIVGAGEAGEQLALERDEPAVYLERLRFAGGEPLALDRSWLPAAITSELLGADLTSGSLYDSLADLCDLRVTGGWERIRPLNASREERQLLRLPRSEAVFGIERLARARGEPVEWRQSRVRGDRYAFLAEWDEAGSAYGSSLGAARGS